MTPPNAKSYKRRVVKTNLYIVYVNMALNTKKMELNDMPHVNVVIWEMSSIPPPPLSPLYFNANLRSKFWEHCANLAQPQSP